MIAGALDLAVLTLAAALAFALLAGSNLVRPLLVNLASRVPVIGGPLASEVENILNGWQRALSNPANAVLPVLTSLLSWLDAHGRHFLVNLGGTFDATYTALLHFQQAFIPHAIALAVGRLEGLIGDARTYALDLVQRAEQRARDLFAQAEADAGALVSAARQEATQEVQAAERVVLLEVRKVEETAGSLFRQAEYDAGQAVAGAELRAEALVSQARGDLTAAVGAVEHDLQALSRASKVALEDSVSILGGDIQAAEARAQAALRGLEAGTQKSIDDILKSLPWQSLGAAVGASEAMLQADVRTLVGLGAQEIRKAVADVPTLRAKFGPEIRAALKQLAPR